MFVVHFYCNINQRRKLLYLFTQCDISYWIVERKPRRHTQQKISHPFSKVVSFRVSHPHITQKITYSKSVSNNVINSPPRAPHGATAPSGPGPHYQGFAITLRQTTLGRTPLDERSAPRRDLYLTTQTLTRDKYW